MADDAHGPASSLPAASRLLGVVPSNGTPAGKEIAAVVVVDAVRAHLASIGASNTCPVCAHDMWDVLDLGTLPGWVTAPDGSTAINLRDSTPLVTLVCRRCFHARAFAWLPIARAAGLPA